jgi:DNA-binding MarR family transcriptional regulator
LDAETVAHDIYEGCTLPTMPPSPTYLDAWRGLLRYHAKATSAVSTQLQSEVGLTLAEFEVLSYIVEHPAQRLPMSELARLVVLTPSGITRMVDRLVRRNLVERQSIRSDARVQHAVITEQGLQTVRKANVVQSDAVAELFARPLDPAQIEQLHSIWKTLEPATASF